MAVYAVLILWLLSLPYWEILATAGKIGPPPVWYGKLNPYVLAFQPYHVNTQIRLALFDLALYIVVVFVASALFTLFGVWTLRRELKTSKPPSERLNEFFGRLRSRFYSWWPSPTLDGNPVLWREWHRNRASGMAWRLWAIFWGVATASTAYGIYQLVTEGLTSMGGGWTLPTNAFMVTFGMLFLSATAPTTLSEERVRGSLDILMSTPLPTRTIVLGKWWAVFRVVPVLAVLPALGAVFYVAASPMPIAPSMLRFYPHPREITFFDRFNAVGFSVAWFFAHGALFTCVGLALATWIARPGRAIGLSVAFYLLMLIGLPMLVGHGRRVDDRVQSPWLE